MPKTKPYLWPLHELALMLIASTAVIGAVIYKIYSLNYLGIIIVILLLSVLYLWLQPQGRIQIPRINWLQLAETNYYLIAFWILLIPLLYLLIISSNVSAIVSPWETISPWFWLLYIIELILTINITYRSESAWLFSAIPLIFISYSLALFSFGIGYGFDPFIHQATASYIAEHGSINPKPLYYAGQYALVVITNKLFFLPIITLDKVLIPLLAAVFLPLSLWHSLKVIFYNQISARLTVVIISLLLTSLFIVTNPQNLAYLFLILFLIITYRQREINWPLIYALVFGALVTQAIAGIPAALALLSIHLLRSKLPYRKTFIAGALTLTAIILPLTFFLIDRSYNPEGALSLNNFDWSWLLPQFVNQENIWLNLSYWWLSVIPLACLASIIIGWHYNRRLRASHANHYYLYLLFGIALSISYLLTKLISFNFLINYERDNYAMRILISALIFCLPFIAISIYELLSLIIKSSRRTQLNWLVIGLVILSTQLYVAYPRLDKYYNSKSYATSATDIKTVQWIHADAQNQDYIVLANQQVSAAALREYGFAKYYHDSIFYYPIPTGGALYQHYLNLTYNPVISHIQAASELTGVKTVYLVINKYWHLSNQLIPELTLIANSSQKIDDTTVFKFIVE